MSKLHNMKYSLLFIFFCSAMSSFAMKTYDVKYSVVDSYTGIPLEGINIIAVNVKSNEQWKGYTNEKGILVLKNVNGAKISTVVQDLDANFEARFVNFLNKKGKDQKFSVALYPGTDMLDAMWELEDKKYGKVDEGVLSASMNKEGLIGGCKANEFVDSEYEGGAIEMQRFIAKNVTYPVESIELNDQGRIYLAFVVEENGTITHVKVERGVSKQLDAEAMRLLRIMPPWSPATCEGEKIRSVARLPINFTLN